MFAARALGRVALLCSMMLLAAACSSPAEPRFPSGQGWVVWARQSADLSYDWNRSRIVAGSVEFRLADGTTGTITSDTRLEGSCQELVPPPAVSMPCWLQVGPATERGHVAWATAMGVRGDAGQPRTWHQDHGRYHSVDPGGGTVREVTAEAIIFETGLVVFLGPSRPRVSHCERNDLRSAAGKYARVVLDIDSGFVTEVSCLRLSI